jgi:hypothetical protein
MSEFKTNDAHISAIREKARQTSDDTIWSDQFIYKLMLDKRADILAKELNKWNTIHSANYQRFCIELEVGSYQDCEGCIPANYAGCILRSKKNVPTPLTGKFSDLMRVYKLDGSSIGRTNRSTLQLQQYSKLGLTAKYEYSNEKVFIFNEEFLKVIEVHGVFYDPTDVVECQLDDGTNTCYDPLTDNFPLDPKFNDRMYDLVLRDLGITMKFPEDRTNNADSSIAERMK